MRRYAAMQKAKDADVFGILIGTLGIGDPFSVNIASSLRLIHKIKLTTYL
jgi:diphthamide synthase subunit DPH2